MVSTPDETPLYTIGEAARLLQVPRAVFRAWLDGYSRMGKTYPPVIRLEPTGVDAVTWAEFIEGGWLREYRKTKVPLQRLRPLIDDLREQFQVAYPLWHFKPLVDPRSKDLLIRAQDTVDLEDELRLIRMVKTSDGSMGLIQWAGVVERFLQKVEFSPEGVAMKYRPLGLREPVEMNPDVQFGIPQIRGFRTEIVADDYAEIGDFAKVAKSWGMTEAEVQAAVRWELLSKAA